MTFLRSLLEDQRKERNSSEGELVLEQDVQQRYRVQPFHQLPSIKGHGHTDLLKVLSNVVKTENTEKQDLLKHSTKTDCGDS